MKIFITVLFEKFKILYNLRQLLILQIFQQQQK